MTMLEVQRMIGEQMVRLCNTEMNSAATTLEVNRSLAFSSLARDYVRYTEVILAARNIAALNEDVIARLIT